MARLYNSGFALQTVSNGVEFVTVGSGTIVSYGSGFAYRPDTSAAASSVRPLLAASDQSTIVYAAFRFFMAAYPAATANCLIIRDASNANLSRLTIATDGVITIRNSANTIVLSGPTLSLNREYLIEYKHDASTSPGTLELRIDGVSVGSIANDIQGPWKSAQIGNFQSTTTDWRFSHYIVNDNSGASENTWVGNQRLAFLYPSGAGDSNQFNNTANGAGGAGNYALVNEQPPNEAVTMVQSGTLNDTDMYSFTNPIPTIQPADTITCVTVNSRMRNNATPETVTAVKLQLEKATSGTILQSAAIIPNTTSWLTNNGKTTDPANPLIIAYNNPDGAAWTLGTVSSLQAGAKITAANVNRIQVTTMWIYVSYIPAANTRTSSGARTKAGTRTLAGARTLSGIRTSLNG